MNDQILWVTIACLALAAICALVKRKPWAWVTVRDTGVHRYQVHPSGQRRIIRAGSGYQPIDRQWLATGGWRVWRL